MLVTNCFDRGKKLSDFFSEPTEAFVSSDIPLRKLQNEHLPTFLEKHTKQAIPHESMIFRFLKIY